MPTQRDYNRTTQRLISLGFDQLLLELALGDVKEDRHFPFTSLQAAKAVQKLLYDWLWFNPSINVSLRVDKETATLTVRPRSKTEKRGRRGEGKRR